MVGSVRALRGLISADRFLRPEVPGFWPSNGFEGISLTGKVIVDDSREEEIAFTSVSIRNI